MSENVMRCLVLSFMMGISCQVFFEAVVPKRKWRHPWIEYTTVPAFAAGIMMISFTEIPPYILQPVRLILVVSVIAQIYFQVHITRNLILSVLFCTVYWCISTAVLSVFYLFYDFRYADETLRRTIENLTETIHLCLMMTFHCHYKSRLCGLSESHWKRFALLPFLCLITIVAFNMLSANETAANKFATLTTVSGFVILSIFLFYFTVRMWEKEEALQKMKLITERTRNQMNMYHNMQTQYEQQRRFLHDYKNQLNCIQGLLDCGQIQEASEYITRMTGVLRTQFGDINTNHTVVNIILNQKYQTARDKGIPITFVINDLSELAMPEEDLVTLLTNLLDNAIEACEKLDEATSPIHKCIQLKMVLEEGQLILSVRNPVKKPVPIKGNMIVTSKKDSTYHGIGLLNVNSVVQKYHGTNVLKCEDGWFSFAAILPCSIS